MRILCQILLTLTAFLSVNAQINQQVIETVLILDGQSPTKAGKLYELYLSETSYKQSDLLTGIALSGLSGVCLGNYESKNYGYTHIDWMPEAFQDWYRTDIRSNHVFSKFFTWQKFWREADYISDTYGYLSWLRYFGNKWWLAYPVHWIVKNTAATIIRDQNKFSEPFHSFNVSLIF